VAGAIGQIVGEVPSGPYDIFERASTQLRRTTSSGMLRRVALVRTDVSEELSACFIRVTRIGELGTTLAVTSYRRKLRRNTKSLGIS
jgi:hypothetical protein